MKLLYNYALFCLICALPGMTLAAGGQPVNPILARADPFVTYNPATPDGKYVLTGTTGNNITLWSGLTPFNAAQHPKIVFAAPGGMTQVWSPTLWELDGRWWIYFTARMAGEHHSIFTLESEDEDPRGPYTFKGKLDTGRPSIDPSLLEVNGARYLMFVTVDGGENAIWLRQLKSPNHFSGKASLIAEPRYEWEKGGGTSRNYPVNEGPTALYHDGKTFVVYSASDTASPAYCLGLLTLSGSNVLSSSSWQKTPRPVFQSAPANHIFGPGRGTFARGKDGNEWLLYAAKTTDAPTKANRRTRAQRFTWAPDGSPAFGRPLKDGPIVP